MKSLLFITSLLFIVALAACNSNNDTINDPPLGGGDPDPGYRVYVRTTGGDEPIFPSHTSDWIVTYKFKVQPLPHGNWNYQEQTIYTYGQIDFDRYGSEGPYTISDYQYNQLVPQVMIGNCLDSSDSNYNPYWSTYDNWVFQAQYYWMNSDDTSYSLCGELIHTSPGAELLTTISYSSSTGQITASISGSEGTSTIIIDKPFPNDTLFTSWADFFQQAQTKSSTSGPYGNAVLNVESHYVDQWSLCSTLPFNVSHVTIPGIPWQANNYTVGRDGNYTCSDTLANKLAILHF